MSQTKQLNECSLAELGLSIAIGDSLTAQLDEQNRT
jgi:hypothetical protein